jgi:MoaA/NifB/PqqE/SkfB family radical SAM enzyme
MTMCGSIIEVGYRPHIITNLAKNYSEEEIDMLAKFSSIQVSLDSDDDALMRSIRKSVRTAHVFETIERILNAAGRLGISPAPRVSFSVGVYDPSIWTLERFVERIVAFGVRNITFWNLVEMDHQRLVEPLRNLPASDQNRARAILAAVRRTLEKADVNYIFAGDFDSMVPQLTGASRLRSILRRARRAAWRRVFSA